MILVIYFHAFAYQFLVDAQQGINFSLIADEVRLVKALLNKPNSHEAGHKAV